MKKMIFSVIAFLSLSSTSFAFMPRMEFFVGREVAISRVWNTSHRPIICNGQAFGRTWQNVHLNSWINGLIVYPNAHADVYVYTNFYDPMVQAWASIDCQFHW